VAALRIFADRTGLTQAISAILARPGFRPVHDRGRVLTDMACTIAGGGVDIVDIEASAYAPPKTPAFPGSRRTRGPSTRPGAQRSQSPST
jgi:hypothetical protein